jgi:hypothetical protein
MNNLVMIKSVSSLSNLKMITSVLMLCLGSLAYAQKTVPLEIKWQKSKTLRQGERTIVVPSIEGQHMNGNRPNYFWREKMVSNGDVDLELKIISTEPADQIEIDYLIQQGISVAEASYHLTVSKARSERHAVLNLFPFIKVGKQVHRIKNVEIAYKAGKGKPVNGYQKDFVTSSALASGSGTWVKISIAQDGIYKIDKAFLKTHFEPLGVDVENLNPEHIHVYGNGDGQLPQLNSVPRTDDLAMNAVEFVGGGDGVLNENDYILFYGWGPNRMYANGTADLYQDVNPYSEQSYYFVNINTGIAASRIQPVASSTNPVTNNLSSYSYYSKHENEIISLVKGGQRWYGELFDFELSKTFVFNVQDIDAAAPATYKIWLAANSN